MEQRKFLNRVNQEVNYLAWEIEHPKAFVAISHGMAEHPERYDNLANYLNDNGINVYATYHIGHGLFATNLGHMDKGDFMQCVDNLHELIEKEKKELNVPAFFLGHSMGSFMGQIYAQKYGKSINGLILSGSTAATLLMKSGYLVASIVYAFSKNKTKPSKFMDKLSFGSYNKQINATRTKFDWLNQDEACVDNYIEDPYCGFVCSIGFFKNLTYGIKQMAKKKNIANIPVELPILIHGGTKDPVSNCAKGLFELKRIYLKNSINDITFYVYENDRHEIYNELNKDEVYKNTLDFINTKI